MKRLAFSTITALCATTSLAYAGGLAPTIDETVVIVQEPNTSSAANIIVPLLIVGLLAAASGAGGTSNGDGEADFGPF